MALIEGSKRDIWVNLNRETLVTIPFEDLVFSAVAKDEGEVDRTLLRLTASNDHPYRGTYVLKYRRLRLDTLPRLLVKPPRLTPRNDLYELLPYLKHALGILFSEEDVENAPIIEEEGDDNYSVVIKAKPTSHGWVGECKLHFKDLPPLAIPVHTTDLDW